MLFRSEWVNQFSLGYESAKRIGDQIGLDVFYGWEANYDGTEFLIYGLQKEWLYEHPETITISKEELYKLIKQSGGCMMQAHPFREAPYIKQIGVALGCSDGIEIYNHGNAGRSPWTNEAAIDYAKQHQIRGIEGSDSHHIRGTRGGMEFPKRIMSREELVDKLCGNCEELWRSCCNVKV